MHIYTGYFGEIDDLKRENLLLVSIAAKTPPNLNIYEMKELAPSYSIFSEYYESESDSKIEVYTHRFNNEILNKLNPHTIYEKLCVLSEQNDDRDICLLCYETAGDFCHRHLVAKWLSDNVHVAVYEFV